MAFFQIVDARAVARSNFRNGGRDFGFWRGARSKAISLVDLAKTDNEAKKQKTPGLRLKLGAGHCVVVRSLQVHKDMRVALA
jgi:hypothetical protein